MAASNFLKVSNYGIGTLSGSLGTADPGTANLNGGNGASFPASGTFRAVVYPADGEPRDGEIVSVTSRSTDQIVFTRGAESTINKAHAAGSLVKLVTTAGLIEDLQTAVGNIETGTRTLDALNVSGTAAVGAATINGIATVTSTTAVPMVVRRDVNLTANTCLIQMQLKSSTDVYREYGGFAAQIVANTNGAEFGENILRVMRNGTITNALRCRASGTAIHYYLSDIPTSNPGAGILWNSSGTLRVGT